MSRGGNGEKGEEYPNPHLMPSSVTGAREEPPHRGAPENAVLSEESRKRKECSQKRRKM